MSGRQRVPTIFSQVASTSKASPYVCHSCRHLIRSNSKANAHQVRYATTPFTEKLRRKIWGTDNPPGLADPYGPSYLERRKMAIEEQKERERRASLTVDERIQEDALRQKQEVDQDRPNIVDRDLDQPFEDDPEMETPTYEPEPAEGYKPAMTWDGLRHIGHAKGKGHWRDRKPHLQDEYHPWMSQKPELPWARDQLVRLIHHAVTETLLPLHKSNVTPRFLQREDMSTYSITLGPDGKIAEVEKRRVQEVPSASEELDEIPEDQIPKIAVQRDPRIESEPSEARIPDVESEKLGDGLEAAQPEVEITDAEAEKIVGEIAATSPTVQAASELTSPSIIPMQKPPLDETFLAAKLDVADPLTFKMLKRFQQLSSTRISDPVLNSIFRSGQPPLTQLINQVLEEQKPKPKNLYEKLMEKGHLMGQSNVMVAPRRETPVDKEKEVGRWKVIERELRERGLPVLGRVDAQ